MAALDEETDAKREGSLPKVGKLIRSGGETLTKTLCPACALFQAQCLSREH